MATATHLVVQGARFIKKSHWTQGLVHIANDQVWAFIHPTDAPSSRPQTVLVQMLPGDDWVAINDPRSSDAPGT